MVLYLCLGSSWHPDPLGVVPVGHRIGAGEPGRPHEGDDAWPRYHCPISRRRPAPILSTPPSNDALLGELPIAPGHPLFSAALSSQPPTGLPGLPSCAKPHHNHTLLAEAGPSPVPSGQFGSRQAPMAIVTPPTFPFPSSLLPRHLHPIPLPSLARGVTLGSQHPGARRCSPASSPSCCRGVCSPACARHAAPVIRTPPCTTSIVH